MKKIKSVIAGLLVIAGITGAVSTQQLQAFAAVDPQQEICQGTGGSGGAGGCSGNATTDDLQAVVTTIVNVLLFIIGTVAVIVIIIGGLRYVTSAGDASKVKAAKDTILYAVIGLIVAILAFAIVNFVIANVK